MTTTTEALQRWRDAERAIRELQVELEAAAKSGSVDTAALATLATARKAASLLLQDYIDTASAESNTVYEQSVRCASIALAQAEHPERTTRAQKAD